MYVFLFTKATIQKPRIQSRFLYSSFYNKKILASFYYVCYLLENETLAQELFGGSLNEVLGTDDGDPKVDFDVIAREVFGASIQ